MLTGPLVLDHCIVPRLSIRSLELIPPWKGAHRSVSKIRQAAKQTLCQLTQQHSPVAAGPSVSSELQSLCAGSHGAVPLAAGCIGFPWDFEVGTSQRDVQPSPSSSKNKQSAFAFCYKVFRAVSLYTWRFHAKLLPTKPTLVLSRRSFRGRLTSSSTWGRWQKGHRFP